MAEGPLVHHYVNQLKKVLQGREVRIEFHLRKLKERIHQLVGGGSSILCWIS